jgi:hypothetical protein
MIDNFVNGVIEECMKYREDALSNISKSNKEIRQLLHEIKVQKTDPNSKTLNSLLSEANSIIELGILTEVDGKIVCNDFTQIVKNLEGMCKNVGNIKMHGAG